MTRSPLPDAAADWWDLSLASWQFWADSAAVMGLRGMRLMSGGAPAEREAYRMVSEKLAANATFAFGLAAHMPLTANEAVGRVLSHYGEPVRRNRRRLSRTR